MGNVELMNKKEPNRWIILIASVIMNICIGAAYAWSVFRLPLMDMFGWGTSETSVAYTLSLSLVPVAMIIGGLVVDKKGPRVVALTGGIIFGIGFFLTGFANSIPTLYLTYGVLGGLGIGLIYGITVSNTVKWFPDKRGLAGGLTAAGFGSGAMLLAPIAARMIEQIDVLTTFKILGIIFLAIIVIGSTFIKQPEGDWKPKGWVPPVHATSKSKQASDLAPSEMLKTSRFYLLWAMYAIGTISGLMIIGHASPIGQEQIGLTPQTAATAVSVVALANTFGRIFWGWVSDKAGRYISITLMYILSAVMLIVLNMASTLPVFLIATASIASSFGGILGIMPSVTAENFGAKRLGINYGILFTAYGLAAIVGPLSASIAKESSGGSYSTAYIIASVMNVVGILIAMYIMNKVKKEKQAALNAENTAS